MTGTIGSEGDSAWDTQLDLSPVRMTARNLKFCSDSFRPLAHAQEAPMPVASRLHYLGIDPAAIVADEKPQLA